MTGTATAGTTKFSWSDHRTIAHALGGLDGRDYLNSREGFLAMYQQGVRLFELDLSRTSDGVWVCRHNWKESMGQWKGSGKKVLTEKQFKNSKIYGTYTPMTLEDFFLLLKEHPDAYVMIDCVIIREHWRITVITWKLQEQLEQRVYWIRSFRKSTVRRCFPELP